MVILGLYDPGQKPINWSLFFVTSLFTIIIYTVIAITTHRVILLGPSSVPEWGIFKPTTRELDFLFYSIGIGLIMIPLGILSLIPVIGIPAAFISIAYVSGRLSLVFPAIATDHAWTLSKSWNATKDHQVMMVVVVAVFPLVLGIPGQLLSYLPYVTILVNIISALTLILVVAALSVAFKVITQGENES